MDPAARPPPRQPTNAHDGSPRHLSGHYVVCAYERVGRAVMQELRRRNYTSVCAGATAGHEFAGQLSRADRLADSR